MGKLEGAPTSEELASAPMHEWTFDGQPQASSAPALPARPSYPDYGGERNHDVDYTDDSPNEDGSSTLESTALLSDENIIQNNNPAISQNNPPTTVVQAKHENKNDGKEEAEPTARLGMGVGATTITKRNAVLTQAIVLDLTT